MVFLGGQFKSATHGQFKSAQGGQFDRILQSKRVFRILISSDFPETCCLLAFHKSG